MFRVFRPTVLLLKPTNESLPFRVSFLSVSRGPNCVNDIQCLKFTFPDPPSLILPGPHILVVHLILGCKSTLARIHFPEMLNCLPPSLVSTFYRQRFSRFGSWDHRWQWQVSIFFANTHVNPPTSGGIDSELFVWKKVHSTTISYEYIILRIMQKSRRCSSRAVIHWRQKIGIIKIEN